MSVLTARIKEVTEHLKANKHDFMARRGLIQMVGKRKRLLKYLERTDFESYKAVVAKLGFLLFFYVKLNCFTRLQP